MNPLSTDPRSPGEGAAARQRTPDRTLPSPGQPMPDQTLEVARDPLDEPTERTQAAPPPRERPRVRPSGPSQEARRLQLGERLLHFQITSKLGEGGMGVVYKALDLERSQSVALKTLHRIDPESISRIKNEFRAAADVAHQNLVTLHELFSDSGLVFFTMELIDGVSFLAHVRDDAAIRLARTVSMSQPLAGDAAQMVTTPAISSEPAPPSKGEAAPSDPPSLQGGLIPLAQLERLRAALRQLVAGVGALHAAGKLHRDLKPGNVMVTRTGRVVILDFSLAAGLSLERLDPQDHTGGTPAYMAPEQVVGLPASPATDWYAVGAMVYQALAGRLPYEGSIDRIIKAKRKGDPPPAPSTLVQGVPPDLEALCMELLRVSPDQRPSGAEIAARVLGPLDLEGPGPRSPPPASVRSSRPSSSASWGPISAPASDPLRGALASGHAPGSTPTFDMGRGAAASSPSSARGESASSNLALFIGREAHLAALEEAYRAVLGCSAATVYLHGRSGMGKSCVVRRFLAEVRQRGEALVLEGRCYERESVPYKAFDSLVDSIARQLFRMPPERAAQLLPEGAQDLARIFPVLQSIEAIAASPPDSHDGADLPELRRRAFRALKALLRRLGQARPLVVWIDDLQWGDRDSAHLLAELLAPPDAPALLLIGTYRTEEEETSPLLKELFQAEAPSLDALILEVGPLGREDAERLALDLLGKDEPDARRRAARIAEESEGSPLFVEELVRYALSAVDGAGDAAGADGQGQPSAPAGGVSLEALILARLEALPEAARALLEVIALAGRPLLQRVAEEAAGSGAGARGALGVLRAHNLVRTRGSRDRAAVETYHDRIREVVVAHLDPEARARHHLRLAQALEAQSDPEPEELAAHFLGAGELAKAAHYATAAAEHAEAALAFDRAADLYRLAAEHEEALGAPPERITPLATRRADALVNAGRCAEAAPIYLAAAEHMPAREAVGLRGKAAEQLLVSGRIAEGVLVLGPTLEQVGLSYPRTPGRALLLVIGRMLRIALRGTRFRERREEDLPAADLVRLDVCWGAVKGLISFDSIRAASFLLKYVLLALAAGTPRHVARALVHFGMITVYEGTPSGIRKGTLLMDEAERIARRLDSPYLDGVIRGCKGIASISAGRFREGVEHLAAGRELLKSRCKGVRWEASVCVNGTCSALLWLGEIRELRRIAPAALREADQIGDVFGRVESDLFCAILEVLDDHPDAARERVRAAMARWSTLAFTYQHWVALRTEVWCDLYEGRPDAARRRLEEGWPALVASKMLRVRLFAIDAYFLRGTVALACAGARAEAPAKLARAAERDARALAKIGGPVSEALAALLAAGVTAAGGDAAAAITRLDAAIAGLDAAGMALHAACARHRKGELLGDVGRALSEEADARMRDQGVVDPRRFRAVYTPV